MTRRISETVSNLHQRCNSQKEAEEAARHMLAENAKHFSAEFSVEASVVCDLEWDGDDDEHGYREAGIEFEPDDLAKLIRNEVP